jgi:HD-GYP domain-containing protein (c-di-GMP phosphodiesterase class II)
LGGKLHGIGKIAVPNNILLKPKKDRTPEEEEKFWTHTTKAVEMLRPVSFLKNVIPYIEGHHERGDGSGYPRGLKGDEIPLGTRIVAAADAYDAITSERHWASGMSKDETIETLEKGIGKQGDGKVVRTLICVLRSRK